MDKQTISALSVLTKVLTNPNDLNETLREITRVTCELMGTRQSAVLLRDTTNHFLVLRATHGFQESPNMQIGLPLNLHPRLQSIMWKIASTHRLMAIDTGVDEIIFPILCTPLKIKGKVIGLLVISDPIDESHAFDPAQRELYTILASLTSLAIERAQAYHYLSSRLAQQAHKEIQEANEDINDHQDVMIQSVTNPDKVIRMLATSFYQELERAGFEKNYITIAASQLLDCMLNTTTKKQGE